MEKGKTKTSDFDIFWDAYGLKRDRIAAERAWKRLSAKDKKSAMAGIETYRKDCQTRGIHMMYAQGYINHRRWEDEAIAATPCPAVPRRKEESKSIDAPKAGDLYGMGQW